MMNLIKSDEKIAILTCMDMRLDPKKFPGLEQSKAYVIRNAGGRANEETIRSLVVAHKFQGAKAIFVIQHTDCGMMNFTNDILCDLLEESLQTAVYERLVQSGQRRWQPRRTVYQFSAHTESGTECHRRCDIYSQSSSDFQEDSYLWIYL